MVAQQAQKHRAQQEQNKQQQNKPSKLDAIYQDWKQTQNPHDMGRILQAARPVLNSAITTYASGSSPLIKSKAKQLAIQAIKSYDPKSKASLNSWIMLQLKGLRRFENNATPIKVPERIRLDNYRVYRARQEYKERTGREPTTEHLSRATGLPPKRISYVEDIAKPQHNEGYYLNQSEVSDRSAYVPGVEATNWQNVWAEYVYHDLDDTNKRIYDMSMQRGPYANKQLSVKNIADELGVSAAAVSQRRTRIADKLAEGMEFGEGI